MCFRPSLKQPKCQLELCVLPEVTPRALYLFTLAFQSFHLVQLCGNFMESLIP